MRKIITILFLCIVLTATAQEASVEKSVFEIQTGLVGVWVNHEFKMARPLTLRVELGFDDGDDGDIIFGYYHKAGFAMTPVITAEFSNITPILS